jgi:cytoskeletal protein CcmA (bactofilin family)
MKKYGFAVLLPLLLIPVFSASAFDARTGNYLSVPGGEVIDEDLFLAGETVRIDGRVNGDLYVAAKTVIITGFIRDGVTVFGNTVVISGRVGNGVLAACQDLEIGGEVKGNVKAFCRVFSLETGAQLEGDLVVAGQRVVISAPVQGYVLGAGSLISVRSSVRNDALFAVRSLSLEQGARIGGDLLYISEKKASISPAVEIAGRVVHRVPEFRDRVKKVFPFFILAGVLAKILSFIMMAVVGLAFALIAPKWMFRLSEAIKLHPGPSAGWGALLLFGVPIAISIAFTTVVGISLAMMAASAYYLALYLAQIITALLIGRLVLGMRGQGAHRGHLFGAFVLGLFLIRLVRFIPGIGMFVWMATALFGLGAFIVERTKLRSDNRV